MASAQAGRRTAYALALLGLLFTLAPDANAIEAFDGRIQAHGFGEMQIRALDADFAEEIDLSQWYNVFNLELEADILPDGWGPFDLLQAYVRVEARYDAIYSNGFGMFPSVSTFGNSSKRLPLRLRDALDQDYSGVINSNAQADPPGSHVFRVPEAGDLDPNLRYRHPRGTLGAPAYRERDPVGWAIEEISAETIDYQRDENGAVVADPKNPMDPADLVLLYRREKTDVPVANPSTLDFTEAAMENDPLVLTEYTVYLLDPLGDLVLEDGQPVIGCGQLRADGSGDRILCRGLPENGSRTAGGVSTNTPPLPTDGTNGSAGSDRVSHHLLLDRGGSVVRDPLTGERLTVAELYGDVLFVGVDADGNLIPAAGPTNEGQAVTGFGSRLDGAGITDDPNSPTKINGALPIDPPNSGFGSPGESRLVGFNGTCSTNRTDTRDAYAVDDTGAFEYDLATRQKILSSGVIGTCVDNRLEKTSIVKRRAFPGFDALFDQEGADAELGVNIDAANPELADRESPVSSVIEPINEILAAVAVPGGCPDVANGGLGNCNLLPADERRFQAEQLILNEVAPLFRGLALERDDPAFYALENVVDWRFTTREVKGAEGGAGGTGLMGPWLPKNVFQVNATLADRANPFRSRGTPTVVARVSSSQFANQTGNLFQQQARAAGDRYHALDVTAFEMAIEAAGGQLALDSRQSRFITNEACPLGLAGTGCKVVEFIFPVPGEVELVITGLDLSKATFAPDPIDPRVAKLDQLVALLGQTGVRLRRARVTPTGANTPSQSGVGPYPNGVLRLGDFVDTVGRGGNQRIFNLLERSGDRFATASSSFGGDFSGILPCQNTVVAINRGTAPQFATFEGRMAGFDFQPSFNGDPAIGGSPIGCIPFTNLLAAGGAGELPLRPAADLSNLLVGADLVSAQGNYIPSQGLIRALETVDFDDPQFNINQPERSWNRGASQSDTFELKEAYADMEFLDSRLWIRFGLQNIVWGKTELFRTTDQFNPQDFALASLPSLEESRIAVLSGRAVYSLYNVGPLEDFRVELAANFDRMKPADLGACGEPYTIDVVCGLTAGFAFHGITGLGVAGTDRPPDAWNDIDGVEFGGRVEFRWDRFSFAIVDFYGYNDFPYPDRIGSYFRDVDTQSGRLRKAFAGGGPCENSAGFIDWQPVPATQIGGPFDAPPPAVYQTWSAGNTRLAAEVDFGARRALLAAGPNGDPSALPTGADTADPLDDWVKHPLAYSVQGIGIDPGCLKPGGVAGGPNENRFDTRLAPRTALVPLFATDGSFAGIDANGDGVKDFDSFANQDTAVLPTDRSTFFNSSTMGQWEREGFSVDDALRWHPGNQQIFSLTCLGTVSIIAALDPAACAWTLFGSPGVVVNDKTLGEIVAIYGAGDTSQFTINFINTLLSNTKGDAASEFNNFLPFATLNRDARDGLTGSVNPDITGNDPFNPGDLDDWMTLGNVLSAQQQALLGCGPFFGTRCDSGSFYNTTLEASEDLINNPRLAPPARPFYNVRFSLDAPSQGQVLEFQAGVGGLDVLGTEPSALVQSFAGFEGTGEVKGTFTRLARREDGELLRVGDGTPGLDLTTCGAVGDPCVAADLLDPSRTRFTVPVSYQLARDALTALEVGLEVLQSNPSVPPTMDISDPSCPPPPGMTDINCAGLEQIQARIGILQATGDIGPGGANEAEYDELTDPGGQFDRQVDTIGEETDGIAVNSQFGLIRNQEGTVGGLTRNVLGTFNVGGDDPGAPDNEDRSAFGRPFQVLDENDQPIEVSIAGSIVDGLEAFGPVNTHVTWSNTPQPGTLGNAGLVDIARDFVLDAQGQPEDVDGSGQFATEIVGGAGVIDRPNPYIGGPVCTRFDPESPYADGNGIVKLPGCRGALSVSVNAAAPPLFRGPAGELLNSEYGTNIYDISDAAQYAGTVEVMYEDFYDPRVDGCIFGPTLRSRDNMQTPGNEQKVYKVQAVNSDGTLDNLTQSLLDATCFNTGLAGVTSTLQQAPANLGGDFQAIDTATDVDAFGNPELDLASDGTITRAALAGFANTPSTHKRAEDLRRRYGPATNDAPQAFAGTLFHPWASCMQSSALFGTAITGNQFNLDGSNAARSRPWAVDSASPAAEQRGPNLILNPEDGLFVLDAGVNPDARVGQEADSGSAIARSKFLCDARTRDLENDFFEGTLRQDLDGDGLIAAGSQIFSNEMAAVSWNLQKFLVASSCNSVSGGDDLNSPDCFLPAEPWALDRCSFSTPQFCRNVKGILGVAGVNRNNYRAGGNGSFGRRDFLWHSGGEVTLNYARRNVFGISADFAEDVTKTNWGVEFTWIGATPFFDNNAFNNTTDSHALNLTVSVDRPTFINFLNANRTFFMNSQWFFQYLTDYNSGFFSSGPFNALFTFAVFTGYYQDRLLPQVVTVYDFRSQSGGFLPQVSYRFTEAFSITVGVSFFIGRGERIVMPVNGIAPTANRAGKNAYTDGTERLLSLIRGRDEAFMRVRWTF